MNISLPPSTDISQIALYFLSTNAAPKGRNWANWKNEEFDTLIDRIEKSSDKAQILKDTQRGARDHRRRSAVGSSSCTTATRGR